jgi:hypothetical protein
LSSRLWTGRARDVKALGRRGGSDDHFRRRQLRRVQVEDLEVAIYSARARLTSPLPIMSASATLAAG